MNIIFGASGHAKEVDLFLSKSHLMNNLDVKVFVVDSSFVPDSSEDSTIMTEDEFIHLIDAKVNEVYPSYVAIGNGIIRRKVVEKFKKHSTIIFPNLIPESILLNSRNIVFGEGNILFNSVLFTVDSTIENHNHFNLNVSISHDCSIGSYNTFSPGVKIAGNVQIGNNNFFGVGACVIDKITIADDIIVGAGAVVVKDLIVPGTYVGVPAKRIK